MSVWYVTLGLTIVSVCAFGLGYMFRILDEKGESNVIRYVRVSKVSHRVHARHDHNVARRVHRHVAAARRRRKMRAQDQAVSAVSDSSVVHAEKGVLRVLEKDAVHETVIKHKEVTY
jgi:hypothetical protein